MDAGERPPDIAAPAGSAKRERTPGRRARTLLRAVLAVLVIVLLFARCCIPRVRQIRSGRPELVELKGFRQNSTEPGTPLTARYLGVTTIVFDDRETVVMADGFVTRPGALRVLLWRIAPSPARVHEALTPTEREHLRAIFVTHSHYDHALDVPVWADSTEATVFGSPSTGALLADGPRARAFKEIVTGREVAVGPRFGLTFYPSRHSPGDEACGEIERPLRSPRRYCAWKNGGTYSVLVRHDTTRILVHGSAGFERGALAGVTAHVVYLGVAQLGLQDSLFAEEYWHEVVRRTKAKQVILVHWDDFTKRAKKAKPALHITDNVRRGVELIAGFGQRDGVCVIVPTVLVRTDPLARPPGCRPR